MKGLRNMKQLRFLHVFSNPSSKWDEESLYFPNSLQYLEWDYYPFRSLPKTFQPINLVGLVMYRNDMVQLWEDEEPKVLPKLIYLSISYSKLTTLDVGLTPYLKRLHLYSCNDLVEVNAPVGCLRRLVNLVIIDCRLFKAFTFEKEHYSLEVGSLSELGLSVHSKRIYCTYKEDRDSSFGNLEKLISVGLCAGTNLDSFVESICGLQCLRKLTLAGKYILEVPKDIDQLECLEELILFSTDIRNLPHSICMLKHLKSLQIISCSLLEKLPEDIGRLECLEILILEKCTLLLDIPNSICDSKCLEYLYLIRCTRFEKLPTQVGRLECLKVLYIRATGISILPDSVCMLKHLKALAIVTCRHFEKLPEDIGRLESLERLMLPTCKLLRDIPNSIGDMKCLKELNIRWTRVTHLPNSVGDMNGLKKLDISRTHVTHLPNNIGDMRGLKKLDISFTSISHFPRSIYGLKDLCIVGNRNLLVSCGLMPMKQRKPGDYEKFCYI